MKSKVLSALFPCLLMGALAFGNEVDTTRNKNEVKAEPVVKVGGFRVPTNTSDSTKKASSKFSFQLTLARVDLGLATYMENGSYTLSSPQAKNLEYETLKTHNFGFEFLQTGYRFNSYFKIYLGAGLDWNHIRLKNNVTILSDQPELTFKEEDIEFKKNRFSSTYLRIPLSFQFRTKDDQKGNKVYFVAGPEVGFLINGKTKQVSEEQGKVKFKDDFNFNPFRYGAFARVGYGLAGLYVKYYANDVFAENRGPSDFKNVNFGIMVGF
ncbi:outer membrane beta-barrel protein [Pedobacter sp. SYSU D00535]|uniref:outer membrane beta-barrel protein n=1 Tax=Pedobacter sp. SYSU D00535 TaxID=2810308 RepID=UPI001A971C59|nr:outer membrane beta-barrel protein [Pedobacter sp. SYSU D00535]